MKLSSSKSKKQLNLKIREIAKYFNLTNNISLAYVLGDYYFYILYTSVCGAATRSIFLDPPPPPPIPKSLIPQRGFLKPPVDAL